MTIFSMNKTKLTVLVITVLLLSLYLNRKTLLTGELMATHDTITAYSLFYITADAVMNGRLPLWDPYTNCGEPFFIIYGTNFAAFLDPVNLVLLLVYKIFRISLLTLFHWQLYFRFLIFVAGAWLWYRKILAHAFSAWICALVLLFSSLSIIHLRQFSFLFPYLLPLILWFFMRVIEDRDYRSLIPLAFCVGITLMNVCFMYTIFTLMLFLLVFYFPGFMRRIAAKGAGSRPANHAGEHKLRNGLIALSVIIIVVIGLQAIPIWLYNNDVIPVARFQKNDSVSLDTVRIDYDRMGGSPSQYFDFLTLAYPFFSHQYFLSKSQPIPSEEDIMYLGNLAFIFMMIGLCFGSNRYRVKAVIMVFLLLLVMLGKKVFLTKLLYYSVPGFSMIRNMEFFMSHFLLFLTLFVGFGLDYVLDMYSRKDRRSLSVIRWFVTGLTGVMAAGLLLSSAVLVDPIFQLLRLVMAQNLLLAGSIWVLCLYLFADPSLHWSATIRLGIIPIAMILELCLLNRTIYPLVTQARNLDGLYDQVTPARYEETRVLRGYFPRIMSWYHPAASKSFTAVTHHHPLGTHHVELRRFYDFRNSEIPTINKDIISGISAPKFKLYSAAVVIPTNDMLGYLAQAAPDTIRNTLGIEEAPPPEFQHLVMTGSRTAQFGEHFGKIEIINFTENQLELRVENEQDAFLYYSDAYDRHWQAFIDQKETRIYHANYAFKSIPVSRGRHHIQLIYNPRYYICGVVIYFLLSGLLCLYAVTMVARKLLIMRPIAGSTAARQPAPEI